MVNCYCLRVRLCVYFCIVCCFVRNKWTAMNDITCKLIIMSYVTTAYYFAGEGFVLTIVIRLNTTE